MSWGANLGVHIDGVIHHVLRNPKVYPGPHNKSSARTTQGLFELDTHRQLLLIWDGICRFVKLMVEQEKSVVILKFGTFSFDLKCLDGGSKKTRRVIKSPYFQPAKELKELLTAKVVKDVQCTPGSQFSTSSYDIPGRCVFLNDKPIAAVSYLPLDVVRTGTKAIFQGILDLVEMGYDMNLEFTDCVDVDFVKKTFKYKFDERIIRAVNMAGSSHGADMAGSMGLGQLTAGMSEEKAARQPKRRSLMHSASLGSIVNDRTLKRPDSRGVRKLRESTRMLSLMSLDLNSLKGSSISVKPVPTY